MIHLSNLFLQIFAKLPIETKINITITIYNYVYHYYDYYTQYVYIYIYIIYIIYIRIYCWLLITITYTIVYTIADNTHRTTWGWPATTQDDDEAPWDRRQGDPSQRARGSPSPLRMHCKRDNIVPRRCSPPDTLCRSRSMFRGTNTLQNYR